MTTYADLLPATKSEKHGGFTWAPAEDNATSAVAGLLTISGTRSYARYRVEEFPADLGRGFILFKLDPGTDQTEEQYAVFCGARGEKACECKGFARFSHCKHATTMAELVAAKQI